VVRRLELRVLGGFDCVPLGGGALGRLRDEEALGGADVGGIVLWRARPELRACGISRVDFFGVNFLGVDFTALAAFFVEVFPSFVSDDCAAEGLRTSLSHCRSPFIFRIISVMT
jgi:hypothetical protein